MSKLSLGPAASAEKATMKIRKPAPFMAEHAMRPPFQRRTVRSLHAHDNPSITKRRTLGVTERQGDSFSALVDARRSPVGSDAARGVPAPRLPTVEDTRACRSEVGKGKQNEMDDRWDNGCRRIAVCDGGAGPGK